MPAVGLVPTIVMTNVEADPDAGEMPVTAQPVAVPPIWKSAGVRPETGSLVVSV